MSSPETYLAAFLCGGLLCLVGQILIDKTRLTPARILVLYVVVGVVLGAVGLYQPLVDRCGAMRESIMSRSFPAGPTKGSP